MDERGFMRWFYNAVYHPDDGWSEDAIAQVFTRMDELNAPLTRSSWLDFEALGEYRAVVEVAVQYLVLFPDPEAAAELRQRVIDELGVFEQRVAERGSPRDRKVAHIQAGICLRLIQQVERSA